MLSGKSACILPWKRQPERCVIGEKKKLGGGEKKSNNHHRDKDAREGQNYRKKTSQLLIP